MFINLGLLQKLTLRQRLTHQFDLSAAIFFGLTYALINSLPGYLQSVLGGSSWEVGILRMLQPGALLLSFYWAGFIRRQPKVPWIIWSYGTGAAVLILVSFNPTVTTVLVGAGVFFMVITTTAPALNSLYKENYPDRLRFQLLANMRFIWACSIAVSGYIMGWYIGGGEGTRERLSHVMIFAALGAIGGIVFYSRIRLKSDGVLRRQHRHVSRQPHVASPSTAGGTQAIKAINELTLARFISGFEKLRTDALFRRFMIAYFLFGCAAQMFNPVFDVYVRNVLHVSNEQIALIYTVIPFLFTALTLRGCAVLLDGMDPIAGRTIFTLLWLITPLLAMLSCFAGEWALLLVYISRVANGIAFAGSTLLWTLSATYFARDGHEAAQYMGVHASLTGLRGVLAPTLGVAGLEMLGLSFATLFGIASLLMAISAYMTWKLWHEDHSERLGGRRRMRASGPAPAPAA